MVTNVAWKRIVSSLSSDSGDFKTVTKIKREPVWFFASSDGENIYIENAQNERPSCKISTRRKIKYKDFETVYSYYFSWAAGAVGVRDEVRQKSRNTAYIFALIKHLMAIEEVESEY